MPGQTHSTTATIQVQPTGTLVRVQKPTPGLKVKTNIKAGTMLSGIVSTVMGRALGGTGGGGISLQDSF